VDVADPRDARVSVFYLLPQGVYRAKAVMPRPGEGGGVFTDMSPSPRPLASARHSRLQPVLSVPRQPFPEDAIFPRTDDMRPLPGGVRGQYRPLREIVAEKGLHMVPLGKRGRLPVQLPRLHAYIVPPGKPHRLLCEIP